MTINELLRNLQPRPPITTPPTHYNTLGDMRTEYLHLNNEWFIKAFGWQYMENKPLHATPINEIEPLRIYKDSDFKRLPVKQKYISKEVEYYRDGTHYAGD